MNKDEMRRLMLRILEGDARPEEAARLSQAMRQSEEFRQEYAELALYHLQLFEISEESAVLSGDLKESGKKPALLSGRRMLFCALAALLMIGVYLLWQSHFQTSPTPAQIAEIPHSPSPHAPQPNPDFARVEVEIHQTVNLVLSQDQPDLNPGDRLSLHQLSIQSGSVHFTLPSSGVSLWATGAAEMDFVDPMCLRLHSGKITADVGLMGKGFTVQTKNAHVVDLGTKFGVDADSSGQIDVVTFEGKVEVRDADLAMRNLLAPLTEGEAIRVNDSKNLQRIPSVITAADHREWSASDKISSEAVITNVRDNNQNRWSYQFYPIIREGMEEGMYAWPYEVNKPRWWSTEGQNLPAWLEGADLVQTLQQELNNRELEINVTLAHPAVLYVFYQANSPIPEWLSRDFEDTGVPLRLSPDPANALETLGRNPIYEAEFRIWKREVLQPGEVHLGSAQKTDVNSPPFYMYGIAAKALTEIESQSN